jgi:hypothetical protein
MDRTGRRMPSELFIASPWHSGLVLDFSACGLFVQMKARTHRASKDEP